MNPYQYWEFRFVRQLQLLKIVPFADSHESDTIKLTKAMDIRWTKR